MQDVVTLCDEVLSGHSGMDKDSPAAVSSYLEVTVDPCSPLTGSY